MRALLLLAAGIACLAVLAACGDDPAAPPPGLRVYLLDTGTLGQMLAAKDPGAMAHVPEADREAVLAFPAERRKGLCGAIARMYVVRLVLRDDRTWSLSLREQAGSGAWAVTEAHGTSRAEADGLELTVGEQTGITLPSPVHLEKTPTGWLLRARGRAFPLKDYEAAGGAAGR